MFGIRKLKKEVKHLLYEKEVQFNRNKLLNEKIEKINEKIKELDEEIKHCAYMCSKLP